MESAADTAPRNAVVLNGDGSERFRVQLPFEAFKMPRGFQEMRYLGDELTAFVSASSGFWGVVVDESSGETTRVYEADNAIKWA